MSIESIGEVSNIIPSEIIKPTNKPDQAPPVAEDKKEIKEPEPTLSADSGISTKDFLSLRTQSSDEDFAILDEVITKMKDNINELGDALEGMMEKTKKVAKMTIGLQLLKATFEAIDKIREGPGGGSS
tara:strand:- start:667 stop:1050 length:384 start_codon:yes stop_codon:yes gene_type:complete